MTANIYNLDHAEVNKFNTLAQDWWQPNGPGKLLHALNQPRMNFMRKHVDLNNKVVLDLGCGGGILSESMHRAGAKVIGIDPANDMIIAAKKHADEYGLSSNLEYLATTVEDFLQIDSNRHTFDVITCMEMLEHVPDFNLTIQACRQLLKPGGTIFLSTINRTPKAYLLAILGAEYVLQLLPKQTHDYSKFIQPAELMTALAAHNFYLQELSGIKYNPLTNQAALCHDVSVNYLAVAKLN